MIVQLQQRVLGWLSRKEAANSGHGRIDSYLPPVNVDCVQQQLEQQQLVQQQLVQQHLGGVVTATDPRDAPPPAADVLALNKESTIRAELIPEAGIKGPPAASALAQQQWTGPPAPQADVPQQLHAPPSVPAQAGNGACAIDSSHDHHPPQLSPPPLSAPGSRNLSPCSSFDADSDTSSAFELRCLPGASVPSSCPGSRRASILSDSSRASRQSMLLSHLQHPDALAAPAATQSPRPPVPPHAARPQPHPHHHTLPAHGGDDDDDDGAAAAGGAAAPSDPWWASAFSFGSHHDQNQRSHMEDRLVAVDLSGDERLAPTRARRAAFFAVCDGHGGAEAAEHLQAHLLGYLLSHPALGSDPLAALRGAVERAEREVLAALSATACNAGSTLLAALLLDADLHLAHVGDCRAVLARGAEPRQLTADHKPCCAAERARIAVDDPAAEVTSDGYIYGELAVSRAIGSQHLKRDPSRSALTHAPDVASVRLSQEDDFVVLASDGLWDKVDNAEAVTTARRVLARNADAGAAARALIERAMRRSSTDNITVIVLCLHERRISLPKTNSMLFRRLAAASDSPRSLTPSSAPDTPAGGATPTRCCTPPT